MTRAPVLATFSKKSEVSFAFHVCCRNVKFSRDAHLIEPLTHLALQKSLTSPWRVISVCWSTCWRGFRSNPVMSNSRWLGFLVCSSYMHILRLSSAVSRDRHNNEKLFEEIEDMPMLAFCSHLETLFWNDSILVFAVQVLKIFVHLCGHGSKHFLTELRRNSTFIQQASGWTIRNSSLTSDEYLASVFIVWSIQRPSWSHPRDGFVSESETQGTGKNQKNISIFPSHLHTKKIPPFPVYRKLHSYFSLMHFM